MLMPVSLQLLPALLPDQPPPVASVIWLDVSFFTVDSG
jgi:hypothetical protein